MNYNFRESKLVFFEGGRSSEFVPKVKSVEKKIQAEKEKIKSGEGRVEIVDEMQIKAKIDNIENKIKESPINEQHKKQMGDSLKSVLDQRGADLVSVDTKKEEKLKKLFDDILKDLSIFEPQIKVLELAEKVKVDIDLKQVTYEKAAKNLQNYYDRLDHPEVFLMEESRPGGLLKQITQREIGELMENYASSQRDLVSVYKPLMDQQGTEARTFVEKLMLTGGIPRIRMIAFTPERIKDEESEQKAYELMASKRPDLFDLMKIANLTNEQKIEKAKIEEAISVRSTRVVMRDSSESFAPQSVQDYKNKVSNLEEKLLLVRRDLYLQLGDEKYKDSFDESQKKMIAKLKDNGDKAIDEATQEDENGHSVALENLTINSLQIEAKKYAQNFSSRFDEIQRLQATDPVAAYAQSKDFTESLQSWNKDLRGKELSFKAKGDLLGAIGELPVLDVSVNGEMTRSEFIIGLKQKPATFKTFSNIVDKYIEQSQILSADVLMRNPMMTELQDNFSKLYNETQPFVKSVDNLMKQLSGESEDSEVSQIYLNKVVYPSAQGIAFNILTDDFIERITNSKAGKMLEELKKSGIESPVIDKMEARIKQAREYIDSLRDTVTEALKLKGQGSGAYDAFIAGGKKLIKIAVMVGATYITGGLVGAAGITGFGAMSVVALGGAVGGALGEGMMEGNWQGFEAKNLLESWCMGTLTMGAGGAIGDLAGKGLGRIFSTMKDTPIGKVLGIGKYAEKYLAAETSATNGIGTAARDFFKRAGGDVKTMVVSEGLGEMAGKDHPVLGFVLSSLAFMHGGMKEGYVSGQKVKIKTGMTVMAEEGKLDMEYTTKEEAVQFLRENRATPEMIASFEKTGKIEMNDDGLAVKIVPKDKLMSETRECLETMNKLKEKMFDMDVARKQVSEGTMTLAEYKAKVHEVQNQAQETIKAIREELHGGDKEMSVADLYKKYLQDSNMPLEQQQMIISTISHMVRIREDSFNFESDLVLDPLGSKEEALKARLVAAGTVARNFDGNIVYKMIDGVLCIRCESEKDYAKFFGNIESHTSTGLALSASESGLGIGIIVVKPHVELSIDTPVIVHELQHIYKQGSNPLEPEMAEHGKLLQSVRGENGDFSVLTADGGVRPEVIQTYLLAKKAFYEHRFKDEVLAFLVTKGRSLNSVARTLLKPEGSYDYLSDADFKEGAFKELGIDQAKSFARDPNLLDRTFHNELNAARDSYFSAARDIVYKVQDAVDFMRDSKGMTETAAREYLRDYLMFADLSKWEFYLNNLMTVGEAGVAKPAEVVVELKDDNIRALEYLDQELGRTYGSESPFTPRVKEAVYSRYAHYKKLMESVSTLPKEYQQRAKEIVEEKMSKIRNILKDSGYDEPTELLEAENFSFKDLIEGHKLISDFEREINEFPEDSREYSKGEIQEAGRSFLDFANAAALESLKSKIERLRSEKNYISGNPEAVSFATERLGRRPTIEEIKIIEPLRQKLNSLKKVFEHFKEFEAFCELHSDIEIYSRFRISPKVIGILKDLDSGHSDVPVLIRNKFRIKILNPLISEAMVFVDGLANFVSNVGAIKKYHEEIESQLSKVQKSEVTKLYFELVLGEGKSIDYETFKLRVIDSQKIFRNLSNLEGFKLEGRGKYGNNALLTLENFLVEHVVKNGENPQELEKTIREKYDSAIETANVTVNITSKALDRFIDEGKYRTYKELELQHRGDYGERREAVDKKMGYADDFVVGSLSVVNGHDEVIGSAPFYGHGTIKLKAETVNARVEFFEGDSMAVMGGQDAHGFNWLTRKRMNPETCKLDQAGAILSKVLMDIQMKQLGVTHMHQIYVEAHILGGLSLNDVESISYGLIGKDAKSDHLNIIAAKAGQKGISFKINHLSESVKSGYSDNERLNTDIGY
ncbi:MAG: hypothetical protein NTZ25_05250 [Candidatus Peregrinibacteria bacterium]|nr:hypothetical protein [Candidatus Peregrinibacteria bacterium]